MPNKRRSKDKAAGERCRDGTSSNSITTWQISLEHILKTAPRAVLLLSLMSFFDRQETPFGGSLSRLREGVKAEDLSRSVEALELPKSVSKLENQDVYRMAEYDEARLGLRFIY
ncbi:hypothetical protein PAAG_11994 [Paracoccidioides lutzii Pb01]|uniref:Uncharacterized protein n=1 Tax=Paracoccidioides lutzii (strain ATCC MYA-826 / Pb01) TaxID=502779 RepID=A0A0A2V592_PARBA|nr:hypothetical protein PAAG_11994 [Paracoccidioides lutzii Pb01]KGQ01315.1 hypothetical protein PAAG_11994 [Paracoccidioides lutzii Pb01]